MAKYRVYACVCAQNWKQNPCWQWLSLVKFKENFYFSCGMLFPVGFSSFLACVRNIYIDSFKTFYHENFLANTEVARIVSQIPMCSHPASIVNILPIWFHLFPQCFSPIEIFFSSYWNFLKQMLDTVNFILERLKVIFYEGETQELASCRYHVTVIDLNWLTDTEFNCIWIAHMLIVRPG